MNSYLQNGFRDREHYLHYISDEYDVPFWMVESLANTLGPDEDFDGLVAGVEAYVYEHG